MFNKMKNSKTFYLILIGFIGFFSCKKEEAFTFSELHILKEKETLVEIVMPQAKGNSKIATQINNTLSDFACDILNVDSAKDKQPSIDQSIVAFNEAYSNFSKLLTKDLIADFPKWEALVDGEISYQNDAIVSIAMNGSVQTGAANSNLVFKFFNFDLTTGKELKTKDLVNDLDGFTTLVKKYYDKELKTVYTSLQSQNPNFKLPETLGFNNDGVIIIYNDYEFGALSKDPVEFTIPYVVANTFLTF